MFSLRTHVLICVALFAAMFAIAIAGNVLQAEGILHDLGAFRLPVMIVFFGLFLAAGFSAIPVMVMLVLGAQRQLGNENVPAVAAALRNQRRIIYVLWTLMALGCAIAIPAAVMGGLFAN